ncbi:ankyrin repeat-containing domain protein [Cladorrhinum sp. PSN259]|nr:ankyrin repeat-containing domain protein [Cladorrhinum sp. PSN259]
MPIYTHLPEDSVRLLRLLPHSDENSPIECQVFTATLSDSWSTHPYEALSYVWGSADNPQLVSINDSKRLVTGNLHAALSHLRDPFIDRTLWIDAICINQEDDEEKGRQVGLMAKIYAKAIRVVVWLGKAADDSDHALRAIRKAAEEHNTDFVIGDTNQDTNYNSTLDETQHAILKLLERPWFQRIWVLQEVAAARSILIKCGPTEIDGHAFGACIGVLGRSFETRPDLQASIPQVVYLIRGAVFRPRHEASPSGGSSSLGIRPLGELVDMHHTRQATVPLDKVYALLGISSDNPYAAGLEADYSSSWKDLFQKLISFCLSSQMSVSTWDSNEVAIIEGQGDAIGEISSIREDDSKHDIRHVKISWNAFSSFSANEKPSSHLTFYTSAKAIKQGDVVCLLQGASAPTIIRPSNGFSTIVMVTVPLPNELLKQKASVTGKFIDLLLVWDWDISEGKKQDNEDYECFISTREATQCLVADCDCLGVLEKAKRSWNFGLLLNRLKRHREAVENIRNAVELYRTGTSLRSVKKAGSGHSGRREADKETFRVLDDLLIEDRGMAMETRCMEYGQTPLSWAVKDGHEAVVRLLLKAGADTEVQDKNRRTPLSWAAQDGHEAVVRLLLKAGAAIDAYDTNYRTPLAWAAEEGHEAVVRRLLEAGAATETKYSGDRTPLSYAAEGGHESVVQLLLATGKAMPDSRDKHNRTSLSYAAESGHESIIRLLLATGKIDADSRDHSGMTPLLYAAKCGHESIVQLLLATGKAMPDSRDKHNRTPLSYAASIGHKTIVQLLLATGKVDADSKDSYNRAPLSYAAARGNEAIFQLLLATGKVDVNSKDSDGRTPLLYAAARGNEVIFQLLLATGKVDANSKDSDGRTPLLYAAANGHEAIFQLLLVTLKVDADPKDRDNRTPLSYAAENGNEAMVQLLLATEKVDADLKDRHNRKPISYASKNGHMAVVQLMLKVVKRRMTKKEKRKQNA